MYVVDEATGKIIPENRCVEAVVGYSSGQVIYGFVNKKEVILPVQYIVDDGVEDLPSYEKAVRDIIFFSNSTGQYVCKEGLTENEILQEMYTLGNGSFPYNKFSRKYEAVENFKVFDGKQQILEKLPFRLSKHMKYTFGLEFETSQGYIPEPICFRDGLIPLRDGSISGLEYSTVILEGDNGLSLLKQQIDTLKRYTNFNKECSLHIHFGNFPLDPDKMFRLYRLCKILESSISRLVPTYTFCSGRYKDNGKDYCNKLPSYRSFNQMYEHLVGRKFFGDFTQPHPNDIRREAKWRIPTRYFWVNFINALCYTVNKTIEFRLLRPTYNFNKILLWIYIFNAILKYAESDKSLSNIECVEDVIKAIYEEDLREEILLGITRLKILCINQERNNDFSGQDVSLEGRLFDSVSYI